uniref:Ribosomal protein S7 n=1 Tax=Gruberia lanceolata TaxID=1978530 RepID=A0A6C0UA33_9CILI|nr:hypothetical protein [Gruberia lanceolata]
MNLMLLNKKIKKKNFNKNLFEVIKYKNLKQDFNSINNNWTYLLYLILKNSKNGLKLKTLNSFLFSYKFFYKISKKIHVNNILDFFIKLQAINSIITKNLKKKKKVKFYNTKILYNLNRNKEVLIWLKKIIQFQPYRRFYLRLYNILFDIFFFFPNNTLFELKNLIYKLKLFKKKNVDDNFTEDSKFLYNYIYFDQNFNLKIICTKKNINTLDLDVNL